MADALEQFIQEEYRNREVPDFNVGDTVRVHHLVPDIKGEAKLSKAAKAIKRLREKAQKVEGKRKQIFEGVVIAKKHGREPGATFTVRKIGVNNIGIEKIFPLYSPLISKIEVVSRPTRVRRSKLYYLRDRIGKRAQSLGTGAGVTQRVTSVSRLEDMEEGAPAAESEQTEEQAEEQIENTETAEE